MLRRLDSTTCMLQRKLMFDNILLRQDVALKIVVKKLFLFKNDFLESIYFLE